jgi:DNA repair protein RadC
MIYQVVSERTAADIKVTMPGDLFPLLKKYASKRQEHFLAVTLGGTQNVLRVNLVSVGILNRTLIHPREIFYRAIKDNACALILAHNHPSGDLNPSREDREATERLVKAGKLMGIQVLDHLIISKAGFYSFREKGEM